MVCIASGPSLTAEDCETVRRWRAGHEGRRVIAVNCSFLRAPWADVLYACDRAWWAVWIDRVRESAIAERWTQAEQAATEWGLRRVVSEPCGGLSARPGVIRQGGNSGHQAVGLALLFGAARVVLLGFDVQFASGQRHWHADHAGANPRPATLELWRKAFAEMAREASVPIINCSAATALTCFPRRPLAEELG